MRIDDADFGGGDGLAGEAAVEDFADDGELGRGWSGKTRLRVGKEH
jgi:hypothetical protein